MLEAGRIVERGTHRALIAADGVYAKMWARQQSDQRGAAAEDRAVRSALVGVADRAELDTA